jgi:hypothetical protein
MLGVACVNDPTQPLGKGGDQGVSQADLMDPPVRANAISASVPQQIARSSTIIRSHAFLLQPSQHRINPAHVPCPLPRLDYHDRRDNHYLADASQRGNMLASPSEITLSSDHPARVDSHPCSWPA